MTTNPLRAARGTTATLATRALKEGELAQNTDTDRLHIGDGTTVSGLPIALLSDVTGADFLAPDDIGVTVQGYDADTAKLDVAQDWTAFQDFTYGIAIDGPTTGDTATVFFRRGGLPRWSLYRNTTTESGSDVGSNLELNSYDDAGSIKSLIFRVTRSTGVLNFSIAPTIVGSVIRTVANFVAGTDYYAPGGTDVAIADGGTNASTARGAAANLATPRVIYHSAVAVPLTGSTSETLMATIPIAAGEMGPNGYVEIDVLWSCTNNANGKTIRARIAASGSGLTGTIMDSGTPTSVAAQRRLVMVSNRNSASVQVSGSTGAAGGTGSISAPSTAAIDTSAASEIGITGQLANSGDTLTLERVVARLYYAA